VFFAQAIQSLEEAGAPYCVIGGLAVSLLGIPRTTYDLDIVVGPEVDAFERVDRALRSIGLGPRVPIVLTDLADDAFRERLLVEKNMRALTYGDPDDPLREVDVVVSPRVDPRDLVARSQRIAIGRLTVRVASIDDLVTMKREAGRPQDLADVEHLERLLRGAP